MLKGIQEKTIILGVINLGEADIETPEIVLTRIRNALKYLAAERLIVARWAFHNTGNTLEHFS